MCLEVVNGEGCSLERSTDFISISDTQCLELLEWIRNNGRKKRKVLRTMSWGTQTEESVKNTLPGELETSHRWDQCQEKQKRREFHETGIPWPTTVTESLMRLKTQKRLCSVAIMKPSGDLRIL